MSLIIIIKIIFFIMINILVIFVWYFERMNKIKKNINFWENSCFATGAIYNNKNNIFFIMIYDVIKK